VGWRRWMNMCESKCYYILFEVAEIAMFVIWGIFTGNVIIPSWDRFWKLIKLGHKTGKSPTPFSVYYELLLWIWVKFEWKWNVLNFVIIFKISEVYSEKSLNLFLVKPAWVCTYALALYHEIGYKVADSKGETISFRLSFNLVKYFYINPVIYNSTFCFIHVQSLMEVRMYVHVLCGLASMYE
jgi:hypothetical protein